MLYIKLNLTVNLGDGYISGSAYFGQKSFKINIQESLENKLVIPDDLQIDSSTGYVLFETEKNEQMQVKCKIIDEPTDMIELFSFPVFHHLLPLVLLSLLCQPLTSF